MFFLGSCVSRLCMSFSSQSLAFRYQLYASVSCSRICVSPLSYSVFRVGIVECLTEPIFGNEERIEGSGFLFIENYSGAVYTNLSSANVSPHFFFLAVSTYECVNEW